MKKKKLIFDQNIPIYIPGKPKKRKKEQRLVG
jgi:hypothetical protein